MKNTHYTTQKQKQNLISLSVIYTISKSIYFQQIVERYELVEEYGKIFQQRENCVHNPVREPFGVVRFAAALDSFDRSIGRIKDADYVAQQLCGTAENQVQDNGTKTTWKYLF